MSFKPIKQQKYRETAPIYRYVSFVQRRRLSHNAGTVVLEVLNMSKIQAVIFDMDGLLIDTEPLWRIAEVRVFTALGVPMELDECRETMGLRLDEAVRYWHAKKKWKSHLAIEEIGQQIVDDLLLQIKVSGAAKDGVAEIMELFTSKGIRMCIASSSSTQIIKHVVDHLGIAQRLEFYHSAEFEPYGKPHPAVFHSTLKKLDVPGESCLVFEDSPRGVVAAKAAGIPCVGVPDHGTDPDSLREAGADLVLRSLREFNAQQLEQW
jgi:HAD superfamily hydrolase (TIGR01509 family)